MNHRVTGQPGTALRRRTARAQARRALTGMICGGPGLGTRAEPWQPRVSGQHHQDRGDGRGHPYGEVTAYDPPLRRATRGRVMPGTILDTDYRRREEAGTVAVSVTKAATGPMTEDEAAGIAGAATSPPTPPRS